MAEVISANELSWVLQNGFEHQDIIYNGPMPLRSDLPARSLAAAFADSVEAFENYIGRPAARVCGIRLRPDGISSRFGVRSADLPNLVQAVRQCESGFGVSMHVRPQDFDGRTWQTIVSSTASTAAELERQSGRPIIVFDLGGGWTPDALDAALQRDLGLVCADVLEVLPHVREFVLEPGQSLATPCEAVACSVVEIRCGQDGRKDVVVDAGFPYVPQIGSYAHRIAATNHDGGVTLLGAGNDRILGCTCLEHDILATNVRLPAGIAEGTTLFICDSGSYDSSMGFKFASGGSNERDIHSAD